MNGEKREFYAETVQQALEKAAVALGVSPEQLSYSVLDEGSSGFLGIGARDARIQVEVPEGAAAPSTDQDVAPVVAPEYGTPLQGESELEETAAITEPAPIDDNAAAPSEEAPDDLIVAVDGIVTELLEKMGFDATVDAYDAGEVVKVDIATKETGLLIGQKGETIDAVQYLLNVIVYRTRPFFKRIVVDTEGYRQRRVEAIQGMAHRTARRAQREKRSLNLPPMAAAERRVVHLYLQENPHVSTSSEGDEENRRVVITPNN